LTAPGDIDNADSLARIYDELRYIARKKMAAEGAGHTLQPTALVHEAWLRLGGPAQQNWNSLGHFLSAAAEAMRRILVEHARRKQSQKRGAGAEHEQVDETSLVLASAPEEVLAVHEAVDRLADEDPAAGELVKLRYFVGLTMDDAAAALGMSVRSAERLWQFARAWLRREIRRSL
jgi:RNA polymerase sigma factor (TIGR02999 family)